MSNLPTKAYLEATNGRAAEYAQRPNGDDTDWGESDGATGGMNSGGCNPGVGINTDGSIAAPRDDQYTALDQDEVARDPQQTQYLGTAVQPVLAVDYAGADFNDTASFVQNTTGGVVVPGAAIEGTVLNRGTEDVPDTAWAWGTNPVA